MYVNGNAQDINPAENLVVHDTRDVNDLPSSFKNHVSYCLGNKGLNNGYHKWKMLTASYAGGYGVKSNGYEIWEYPDVLNQDAAKRRFVIQTSRDQNSFSAIIIGPKGGLHIGYPPHSEVADINDLSVNGNVGIGTLDTRI